MKLLIGVILCTIGFAFIKRGMPLEAYDIIGIILIALAINIEDWWK